MEFGNPIVGGSDELVRAGIQSRGYTANSVGWRVDRNGNAEFNTVRLRGGLVVTEDAQSANFVANTSGWRLREDGSAEFNGPLVVNNGTVGTGKTGTRVVLDDEIGPPPAAFVKFYDDVHSDPALLVATDDGDQAYITMMTGDVRGAGNLGRSLWLDTASFNVNGEAQGNGFTLDMDDAGVGYPGGGNALSLFGVPAGIWLDTHQNFVPVLVKGKAQQGITTTALVTNVDTNVLGANVVNVPVQAGYAYRYRVHLDYFRSSTGALARFDVKIWDGAVGGTGLLGNVKRVPMAGALSTVRREFNTEIWFRAPTSKTIANLNISISCTDATAGQNWTTEVNGAFSATIEEMGDPARISGL